MKKKLITIIAVMCALIMSLTSLSACNLVTTNNDKDMEQVVATVAIDGAPTENITKREMILAYMNYGYYYVNYGYTRQQVFEIIIDNLVSTRIMVQNALKTFNEDATFTPKNAGKDKWDVERYLTVENTTDSEGNIVLSEINEATYNTYHTINHMIESYMDEEENKADTLTETVRDVPTGAAAAELTDAEKQDYIDEGIIKGEIGSAERKAYNKFIKLLENNSLLGAAYNGDVKDTDYYKDTLKSAEESIINNKYENIVKESARKEITFETLKDRYVEMYEAQKSGYDNNKTAYESALSSNSAKSPLVYNPFSGYGYVYNLLIGASDEQTTAINYLYNSDNNNYSTLKRATLRRDILQSTIAKDLRSTWILSGYDFDYATKRFTGDYAFATDSLEFKGEVTLIKEKGEETAAEYRIDSVNEYGLDEFIELINEYVYGSTVGAIVNDPENPSVYYKATVSAKPDEYEKKINELLFAFSTDSGSLNTYKGYSISPIPDAGQSETYMQEFADAARELIGLKGASYMITATTYGYHIMFFSEVLNADTSFDNLVDYLNYVYGENLTETEWKERFEDMLDTWDDYKDTDGYLYIFEDAVSSSYVSNALELKQNEVINKYRNDTNYVVVYTNRFSDLLG